MELAIGILIGLIIGVVLIAPKLLDNLTAQRQARGINDTVNTPGEVIEELRAKLGQLTDEVKDLKNITKK